MIGLPRKYFKSQIIFFDLGFTISQFFRVYDIPILGKKILENDKS
jgi:hypothetical protein